MKSTELSPSSFTNMLCCGSFSTRLSFLIKLSITFLALFMSSLYPIPNVKSTLLVFYVEKFVSALFERDPFGMIIVLLSGVFSTV